MPEWLTDSVTNGSGLTLGELTLRLIISLAFGSVVAGVYILTQRRNATDHLIPFATTLVLLTVLISMVTLVIGNSVARAFSLAGALAIIRFRTVVEDTRDTAFVIFGVVVGMAVGAHMIIIPLVGVPIVAAAAFTLSLFGNPSNAPINGDYALAIRLGLGRDPSTILKDLFGKHLTNVRLCATTTARQGAAIDLTYVVRLQREAEAVSFVTELNQIEGVQNVELRQM